MHTEYRISQRLSMINCFLATCSTTVTHPIRLKILYNSAVRVTNFHTPNFTVLDTWPTLHASVIFVLTCIIVMIRHVSCSAEITWAADCCVIEENTRLQHSPHRRKKPSQRFDFLPRGYHKQPIVLGAVWQLTGQTNLWLHFPKYWIDINWLMLSWL